MFGSSAGELILIFVIGLLILGPERLPRVAAQIGRWVGKARRTANQLRYQLEREIALEEIYKNQQKKKPHASSGTPTQRAPDARNETPSETATGETSAPSGASSPGSLENAPETADASPASNPTSSMSAVRPDAAPSPAAATENPPPSARPESAPGGDPAIESPPAAADDGAAAEAEAGRIRESSGAR